MSRPLPWAPAAMLLLAACASSPGYRPSGVAVPPAFRESVADTGAPVPAPVPAAPGVPADSNAVPTVRGAAAGASSDQAAYWRALGDTTLDRLVTELLHANLDVRAAA